jgi:hypothetical protein
VLATHFRMCLGRPTPSDSLHGDDIDPRENPLGHRAKRPAAAARPTCSGLWGRMCQQRLLPRLRPLHEQGAAMAVGRGGKASGDGVAEKRDRRGVVATAHRQGPPVPATFGT